jgi:hypothetical protein
MVKREYGIKILRTGKIAYFKTKYERDRISNLLKGSIVAYGTFHRDLNHKTDKVL